MQRKKCGDGAAAGGGNNSGRLSLGRLPVEVGAVVVRVMQDGRRLSCRIPLIPLNPAESRI